jgi:hypothetical protein
MNLYVTHPRSLSCEEREAQTKRLSLIPLPFIREGARGWVMDRRMVVLPVMGRKNPNWWRGNPAWVSSISVMPFPLHSQGGSRGWSCCDIKIHCCQLFFKLTCLDNYLFVFLFMILFSPAVLSQEKPISISRRDTGEADTVQTVNDYIEQNVANLAPPKYIEQRQKRNVFHRKIYADVLFDESNNDGLTALFGYIKLELHINYSMESLYRIFHYHGWPIPDYYGFPVDPWKKEWWFYR